MTGGSDAPFLQYRAKSRIFALLICVRPLTLGFVQQQQALSVVLPCFNEAANIGAAVHDVLQWMDGKGMEGEVIVVDDGSRDTSAAIIRDIAARDSRVRLLEHTKNRGYGATVRTGCDAATKEWIGFMDSDGQFHAADFDVLLAASGDALFVTGRRRRRADSLLRNIYGKALGVLAWLFFGIWVRDMNCGMKLFRADVWRRIRPVYGIEKLFNTELFLLLRQENIPWNVVDVDHYPRIGGSPTGASVRAIVRMGRELWELRQAYRRSQCHSSSAGAAGTPNVR
jgi:glycosyltransferase involved in cell wall biosynthesis